MVVKLPSCMCVFFVDILSILHYKTNVPSRLVELTLRCGSGICVTLCDFRWIAEALQAIASN